MNVPNGSKQDDGHQNGAEPARYFVTTQWSMVLAAGRAESTQTREALETLCSRYWTPLYFYIRRRGYQVDDAQDLIQGFFAQILDKKLLEKVEQGRGRFRSFLLAALKFYVSDEGKKARAQKRGGDRLTIPMDFEDAERRYSHEPVDTLSPEKLYERRWVLALLERTTQRLRENYARRGQVELFDALAGAISAGAQAPSDESPAVRLDMKDGALRTATSRLRQRYRELLREEVAETIAEPEAIDDEIGRILAVLG